MWEGENTAGNKTTKWHEYRPFDIISHITTPNKTVRIKYF